MKVNLDLGFTQVLIIKARTAGLLRNELAYLLATAYHETAHTMKPVVEAYWLSEAWRKKHLPYYPWHGRGFVQITWKTNYINAGQKLGLDLTTNPNDVLKPDVSADIIIRGMKEGWFRGKKKLSDYITLQKSDFFNARDMINGDKNYIDKTTKKKIGELIADYAKAYDEKLKEVGYGEEIPFKVPVGPVGYQPDNPGVLASEITKPSQKASFAILELIEMILKLLFRR